MDNQFCYRKIFEDWQIHVTNTEAYLRVIRERAFSIPKRILSENKECQVPESA